MRTGCLSSYLAEHTAAVRTVSPPPACLSAHCLHRDHQQHGRSEVLSLQSYCAHDPDVLRRRAGHLAEWPEVWVCPPAASVLALFFCELESDVESALKSSWGGGVCQGRQVVGDGQGLATSPLRYEVSRPHPVLKVTRLWWSFRRFTSCSSLAFPQRIYGFFLFQC